MKDRLVIWGVGRLLKGYHNYIDMDQVVCFLDSALNGENRTFLGKEILSPEKLRDLQFDYLIIFSSEKYDEIYHKAVNDFEVAPERIKYWCSYFVYKNPLESFQFVERETTNRGYTSIIDYNLAWSKCLNIDTSLEIYGYEEDAESIYPIHRNVYSKIYSRIEDIPVNTNTAIFVGNIKNIDNLDVFFIIGNAIYIWLDYSEDTLYKQIEMHCEDKSLTIRKENLVFGRVLCITRNFSKSINIYIATHKEFTPPDLDIYIPLWVGLSEDNKWGYQDDKQMPSISHLNHKINECTALYWMWKHIQCDYIGLVHYRRYFVKNEGNDQTKVLNAEDIVTLLSVYDIITAPKNVFLMSVAEQLEITTEREAFLCGMKLVRRAMAERQPDYLDAFDEVMNGNTIFPCNMMITGRKLFGNYCEWLFSIILEVAEEIDISKYESYSKRIIGFMAERLFTVWLMKQSLKIKEMPVYVTETVSDSHTDIRRRRIKSSDVKDIFR